MREALPQVPVRDRAPFTSMYVITRADVAEPVVREDRCDRIITKLQAINFYELRQFTHYLKAWGYVHPDSVTTRYFDLEKQHFERVLLNRPCYEINVPAQYTNRTYDQLVKLLFRLDEGR